MKILNTINRSLVACAVCTFGCLAQASPAITTLPLVPFNTQASGSVTVADNPVGVDTLDLSASQLLANTRYTVFLMPTATIASLPAQFLGEFTSDASGNGSFFVQSEVVNAFAVANNNLENAFGVADIVSASDVNNGAFVIPVNFIQVYEASGTITALGGSELQAGGFPVLSSASALPETNALVANLGPDLTTTVGGFLTVTAANSLGENITSMTLVESNNGNTVVRNLSPSFPQVVFLGNAALNNHPGDTITFTLTLTDAQGNTDTDELTVTVVQ